MESAFSLDKATAGIAAQPPTLSQATIPVHFHVIQSGTAPSQGSAPDHQIMQQLAVLNTDFENAGLKFVLSSLDRTTNPVWFRKAGPANREEAAMKRSLRKGDEGALNIYTVGFEDLSAGDGSLLGYATFPYQYSDNPQNDGVVIRHSTMPGGTASPYNLGKQLVHQVGHWAGLYHTFQGRCDGAGDMVADTAAEAFPSSGCPTGRDTCGGGDVDPINNYMDYSDDECLNQFTPGQIHRLRAQIMTYRGITGA